MIVSAPASSANLGPGFDCLGLAVDLPFELADEHPAGERWLAAEPTHPAAVAFVAAGGDPARRLWWRSPIPPGRGLGFSGAARVAGAYLAGRRDELDHDAARDAPSVSRPGLEGHADNAVASALGGFTVAAGEPCVVAPRARRAGAARVVAGAVDVDRRLAPGPARRRCRSRTPRSRSPGRRCGSRPSPQGDLALLREACEDRVHQPGRLAARPDAAGGPRAPARRRGGRRCVALGLGPDRRGAGRRRDRRRPRSLAAPARGRSDPPARRSPRTASHARRPLKSDLVGRELVA